MRPLSHFDCLLAQTWQHVVASLRNSVREEPSLTLLSTWTVSALLEAGLSPKEPEIQSYLVQLDNWVEQLDANVQMLDESSTGLLGLCLYLRRKWRKCANDRLEELFLRSVELNLQKSKALSLSTSIDLLTAVAAGLESASKATQLRAKTSERLQALLRNASALESVQILQSWELIKRMDDIPRLDMHHTLESIVVDKNSTIVERAMAYYGLLRMAELLDIPNLESEMQFLSCLGLLTDSGEDRSDVTIKAYTLSLPYLKRKMSYDSLFDNWQKYTDSSFKRAKTENYLARYLFVLCIVGLAATIYWPWFRQLDIGFQVSIASVVTTAILMLTAFTIETVSELHGRQFWQKGKVEILIGLLGILISLVAVLVEALLK